MSFILRERVRHLEAALIEAENRVAALANDVNELRKQKDAVEAQVAEARKDVRRLDYRESKWHPDWKLPITLPDGTVRVFTGTYRDCLDLHMHADGLIS